jgi:uncharacterized phage-associated protein
MEYLRLLKLLYIADRENVRETGDPITFSRSVAMDNGPLSSEVYDLIKGEREDEGEWSQYISTHGNSVRLITDPGRGLLTKGEIAKLNEVSMKFESLNTWDLVEHTHTFEEWKVNEPAEGSSRPIPFGAIIEAVGLKDQRNEILADLAKRNAASQFFEEAE